jgi:uncharacterized membrane protein YphA (DoxX/SURF4 family)
VGAERADLRPLALCRIAIGALLLLRTTPLLAPLHLHFLRGVSPLFGWPDHGFHAPLPGLALPAPAIAALCVIRTIAAIALMLGVGSRPAGVIAGAAGYLVLAQDELAFVQTLHLLYGSAILIGLTDAGAALAIRPDRPRAPASSLWLIRIWIASIYFWAGIAKLRADWLDGRAFAFFLEIRALRGPIAEALLATPRARASLACAIAAMEILLGPALIHPRTRRLALALALSFHLGVELMSRPDLIGWTMASLLLVFAPWPRIGAQGAQEADSAGQATSD